MCIVHKEHGAGSRLDLEKVLGALTGTPPLTMDRSIVDPGRDAFSVIETQNHFPPVVLTVRIIVIRAALLEEPDMTAPLKNAQSFPVMAVGWIRLGRCR